jgi:putative ABC transport system ATP-binding protein
MALIEVKNLSKVFSLGQEKIWALNSVNLSIAAGEFVAITGPSGSGKSTLMHILGLLDRPTAGQFLLDGRPVESLPDNELARLRNQKIGFVFQNFYLLPKADALRNVAMPLIYAASYQEDLGARRREELARAALERVGLVSRMDHRPNELSGGQKQRVAIARAIVNRPQIIFADEPTGNLDQKSGAEVLRLFAELNAQGVTVVLVTHDPKVAKVAKRDVFILDGKLEEGRYAMD